MGTMKATLSRLHHWLTWLAMAGWIAELYLIGAALFGVAPIQLHRGLGYALAGVVLLILVVALAGRLGRRQIGLSALLLVLTIVQGMLPELRASAAWLAAVHPVNALTLMGVTAAITRFPGTTMQRQKTPSVVGEGRLAPVTAPD
jgi:hypothetical protein